MSMGQSSDIGEGDIKNGQKNPTSFMDGPFGRGGSSSLKTFFASLFSADIGIILLAVCRQANENS